MSPLVQQLLHQEEYEAIPVSCPQTKQNPACSLRARPEFQQVGIGERSRIECIFECNLTVLLILFAFHQLAH
ncbi:hypothetical protein [Ancylobacter amanitiformis]|uniref:Uncharacterized protein n=1 Tax=Ancylobacter amanitiformis TaxID=217069 RepID=A0ABU0LR70_9HYPH|nr:hypothetical protein [Ancylobacter amanitiformis]MDQ0511202.1 hypothetical protein [Ancylobacter amanitiformis]